MDTLIMNVEQLNRYVRSTLESDKNLNNIFICGELSGVKAHFQSGHIYFTLKYGSASIKSVMFRSDASRLRFLPKDGISVIIRGRVSVYEKDGQYQLYASDMQPDGIGSIALQFEQLKEKLSHEGLFDLSVKKQIPIFPKKIGVVTAKDGAAIQDILNVTSRRCPLTEIIISPAVVQGKDSPESVISAMKKLINTNVDIVIVGRGGGSVEDLSAFNDETLARYVFEYPIPVISAVGHETDYTIIDFVSDLRAPTPSAAAEIAVPDISELSVHILNYKKRTVNSFLSLVSAKKERLSNVISSPLLLNPAKIYQDKILLVDNLKSDLIANAEFLLKRNNEKLKYTEMALNAYNPFEVLTRGFSIAQKNGKTIKSVNDIKADDNINLILQDGECQLRVISSEEKK